jgi:type IV secretory pathway TraG/TraD family ATPase VirD4
VNSDTLTRIAFAAAVGLVLALLTWHSGFWLIDGARWYDPALAAINHPRPEYAAWFAKLAEKGGWLYYRQLAITYLPAAAGAAVSYLIYRFLTPSQLARESGSKLISGAVVLAAGKAVRHSAAASRREADIGGILIHPDISIPRALERQGILALGSQRSGKTQAIDPVVRQALARGDKLIILDVKGDWISTLTKKEARILAPWDARSVSWDIAADCRTELDAELFSATVIAERGGEGAIWSNAARAWLTGLLVSLIDTRSENWGWRDLADLADLPRSQQISLLTEHYPPALKIVKEASKTTDSVEMNLSVEFSFLRHAARAWPDSVGGFSFRKFLLSKKPATPAIIIAARSDMGPLSDAIVTAALELTFRLGLSLHDDSNRRIWWILDELAQIPRLPNVQNVPALGSSKGLAVVIGTQDFDLLVKKYDSEVVNALAGMLKTKIILSHAPGTGAEFASGQLGEREIDRQNISLAYGGGGQVASGLMGLAPAKTESWQRTKEPNIAESEISALPLAHIKTGAPGWLRIEGRNAVYRLAWPIRAIPQRREPIAWAAWTGYAAPAPAPAPAPTPAAAAADPAEPTTAPAAGSTTTEITEEIPDFGDPSPPLIQQHAATHHKNPEIESALEEPLKMAGEEAAAHLVDAVVPGAGHLLHLGLELLGAGAQSAGSAPAPAVTITPGATSASRKKWRVRQRQDQNEEEI